MKTFEPVECLFMGGASDGERVVVNAALPFIELEKDGDRCLYVPCWLYENSRQILVYMEKGLGRDIGPIRALIAGYGALPKSTPPSKS